MENDERDGPSNFILNGKGILCLKCGYLSFTCTDEECNNKLTKEERIQKLGLKLIVTKND